MTTTINAKSTGIGGLDVTGDASGSLGLQTGGVTAVTIDTSQNVGIGTSTVASGRKLQVEASGDTIQRINSGGASSGLGVEFANNGTLRGGIGNGSGNISGGSATTLAIQAVNEMVFASGGYTERMRIDANGNVLINSTSAIRARIGQMQIKAVSTQEALTTSSNDLSYAHWAARSADAGAGTHYLGYFENSSGTNVGAITHNNTNTSYTTSSDYRLKENIVPMTGALVIVQALKPVTYKWKQDGSDGQGFIAHELAEIVPDAVTGNKDAVDAEGNPVYQGIDTSFLVATLTAAIQEQQTIINDLKARIETLEAR